MTRATVESSDRHVESEFISGGFQFILAVSLGDRSLSKIYLCGYLWMGFAEDGQGQDPLNPIVYDHSSHELLLRGLSLDAGVGL